jgi:hypothetical protein
MGQEFVAGDRVERLRGAKDRRRYWRFGVVAMVVPAGVSPYAMWRRWLRDKGECKMLMAREPLMHKERVIVEVNFGGKRRYYCPCLNTLRKV